MTKHVNRHKNTCVPHATTDLGTQQCVVPQARGNAAAQDALGEQPWVEPEWSRNLGAGDVHPHRYRGEPLPANAAAPRRTLAGGEFSNVRMGDGGIDLNLVDVHSDRDEDVYAEGPVIAGSIGQLNERETRDEATAYGVRGRASLGRVQMGPEDGTHVSVNTPHAEGELSLSPDSGFTASGGASIMDAEGMTRLESLGDTRINYGVRGGLEAGLNGHWGDTDGDDRRELGFTLNAGLGTIVFTTEALDPILSLFD